MRRVWKTKLGGRGWGRGNGTHSWPGAGSACGAPRSRPQIGQALNYKHHVSHEALGAGRAPPDPGTMPRAADAAVAATAATAAAAAASDTAG